MKYISQSEFARRIGRTRSRVGQLVQENKVKFRHKKISAVEIPESEVDNFINTVVKAGRPKKS